MKVGVCLLVFIFSSACAQTSLPKFTANEIADRVESLHGQSASQQLSMVCERTYTLDYHGFPESKHAEIKVRAEQNGAEKEFTITSESGSEVLRNKVLHKMIETEREVSTGSQRESSRLVRANYDFTLIGTDVFENRPAYVLHVEPKMKSKVAWQGKIWVDAEDFAVVRAEGQPDKLSSWWTTHSEFVSTYQKIAQYWIPAKNVSDTRVRFGGHAHLVIDYGSCSVRGASNVASSHGDK